MHVELTVREGPLEGQTFSLQLGRVVVGRSPGPGGVTLPGDMLVALKHGELCDQGGQVVYRNLSPGGTTVNGKKVEAEKVLKSGARLAFGDHHVVEVQYQAVKAARSGGRSATHEPAGGSLLSSGPLANPVVRVLLAVYGIGFLAVVFLLAGSAGSDLTVDFQEVREEYTTSYAPVGVAESEIEGRIARAEALVVQLKIVERKKDWIQARKICRQLMAIDSDPASPVYQFAAQRLGDLSGRR